MKRMIQTFTTREVWPVESRTFDSFPSVLKLYHPEEAYFFAALSSDRNSDGARMILNGILQRTVTCKPDSLFHDEWLLVREYVASIEGRDVKDTNYLTKITSVQLRLRELVAKAHPFRFINQLHSLSRSSLQRFLMAEHANNHFENEGAYVTEKEAREYAIREMSVYTPMVRKMIDFK